MTKLVVKCVLMDYGLLNLSDITFGSTLGFSNLSSWHNMNTRAKSVGMWAMPIGMEALLLTFQNTQLLRNWLANRPILINRKLTISY